MNHTVYAVRAKGKTIYVGCTSNFKARSAAHRSWVELKPFRPFAIIPIRVVRGRDQAERLEHKTILEYKRRGQCVLNRGSRGLSYDDGQIWHKSSIQRQVTTLTLRMNSSLHLRVKLAAIAKSISAHDLIISILNSNVPRYRKTK